MVGMIVALTITPIDAQSSEACCSNIWHTLRDPDAPSWYGGIWKTWSDTFTQGDTSILIPINTFHMRFAYTEEQIARYTEWPLGFGVGRTQIGEKSSRMVFASTMQDSHGTLEYQVGYLWLRNRYPFSGSRGFFFGYGYTLNIVIREQLHYRPVPVLFPVAAMGYKRLTVGTTYVPGWVGYGNVFVTGAHVSF
jgi:hypothetical protein